MNINPDYQRDVVWSEQRMIHLIDSLFNNYYVPPLIFKAITGVKPGTNERRKWRTCIDGKQRLTTLRKFFDGEIPYIDKHRQKWYYCDPSGSRGSSKSAKVLSEEDKEFFNNIQIVNIEFEHLTDEQEEDMFQRVQLGVPLTVAEKLAALTGQIPSFINDIRKTYSQLSILMGTKRSKDYQLTAMLIYLMYCHTDEGEDLKLKAGQAMLRRFVEDPNPDRILTPAFRAKLRKVFTKYNELILLYPDAFTHLLGSSKAKSRRFSPVEYLGVGVLLDRYPDRPIRALAEDIKAFRSYLRDHLQDLRTNSTTWTHVMEFINELEDSRGYYPPEEASNKRVRTTNGAPTTPQRVRAFNPPTPDKQIQAHHTTTYNPLQQKVLDARMAQEQRDQREAFHTVPSARVHGESRPTMSTGRGPDHAGGVQSRDVNGPGAKKRTHDGVPVKREV
jgi:hypothetical protein